jgi:CRP-like cAMP-binding protein
VEHLAQAERTKRCAILHGVAAQIELFIRKLRERVELSRDEELALRNMNWSLRRFERSQVMVRAGEELDHSMLLLSGFALRCKYAPDGARQIVEINLAGDFIDLHGFILKRLEHEISAASRCEIGTVSHADLQRVTEQFPRLSRVLWLQTLVDAAIHREWMLVLGKKRGRARVAQFFCELHKRLKIVGLTNDAGYDLPFNQQELADITGMTPVHLNRCLKELRDAGLVTFRQGSVDLIDKPGLSREAQFDPGYLHLGRHEL